jgi:hypothetical protein
MAVALGLPEEDWGMGEHYVDPRLLFEREPAERGSESVRV